MEYMGIVDYAHPTPEHLFDPPVPTERMFDRKHLHTSFWTTFGVNRWAILTVRRASSC